MLTNKKESFVIASPLAGVLKFNNQPLANAKIIRRLRWNGNDAGLVQEFSTDGSGSFSVPSHEEALELGKLAQFVSSAKLEVEVDGELYDLWYSNKFEKELYAETGGELAQLVCDLDVDEVVVKSGLSKIMTVCRWAGMPDY